MHTSRQPIALITGFTIHGLALAQALNKQGVSVHAFTLPGRMDPARYTHAATVHVREQLNSDVLIEHLLAFARTTPEQPIVLFPTSDRMVASIARHWDDLRHRYLLSWAECREQILALQLKDRLPMLAKRAGILHPQSVLIEQPDDVDKITDLPLPCIVKPVRPLSAFKALLVHTRSELLQLTHTYANTLPFIAQQWIEGADETLYACTTFLDHGHERCIFTSKKLIASPPGLGQGIIFTAEPNEDIKYLTRKFLNGLALSGPVALEFKRDREGQYWMIEPNVGRTEYCVNLSIQSGVNLPWIEYCQVTGRAIDPRYCEPSQPRTWFDTDKDPWCYIRHRRQLYHTTTPVGTPIFPFYGTGDYKPLLMSCLLQCIATVKSTLRWLLKETLIKCKRPINPTLT